MTESTEGRTMHEDLTAGLTEALMTRGENDEIDPERLARLLLEDCVRERASDVHLDPESEGLRVRLRVDGRLIDAALLTREEGMRLVNYLKTEAGVDPVHMWTPREERWDADLEETELDIRLTLVPTLRGPKLTLRLLYPEQAGYRLEELGMSSNERELVERWLGELSGMFAVAGPTAMGKTTTLYALLHELREHDRSIVTIEDPVEYGIDGIAQIQVDHRHDLTFRSGLKTMLRLDPDYMMVGEIRDESSAEIALDAAVAGRVILSTLHSRDAAGVITALRNWDMENHEIAAGLAVVVSQRLVRTLCESCREKVDGCPDEDRRWIETLDLPVPESTWQAPGCEACHGLGHHGRTGIFEVWRLREEDYGLILDHADENEIRRHLDKKNGFRPMIADGLVKAAKGQTSLAELRVVHGLSTDIAHAYDLSAYVDWAQPEEAKETPETEED